STGVPLERANRYPGCRIPQTRCSVIGDRQEVLAIGGEEGVAARLWMVAKGVALLPAPRFPHACRVIGGRRGPLPAVGAEGRPQHIVAMPLQKRGLPAPFCGPHCRRFIRCG